MSLSIYFYNSNRIKQKDISEKIDISAPSGIEIVKNSRESIIITNDGEWKILSPFSERADEGIIRKLIDELASLKAESSISDFKNLEEYGLNPPLIKLKVYSESGMKELLFGEKSVDENFRYFIIPEKSNKIFLCYSYKVETLFEEISEFRDRIIFHIPSSEIEKVIIKSPKFSFIIRNETNGEKQWIIENRKGQLIKNFNEKLVDIYSLSVYKFLDKQLPFTKNYQIGILSKNSTNTLWLSKEIEKNKWLASTPDKIGLFIIENENLSSIFNLEEK